MYDIKPYSNCLKLYLIFHYINRVKSGAEHGHTHVYGKERHVQILDKKQQHLIKFNTKVYTNPFTD